MFFSNANFGAPDDPSVYFTALDLGFDENDDLELTLGDPDDPFLSSEVDDFLISEDLDQTTNSLDLQANREASGGAAVRACNFACSPGSGSSAVSCKQSPNEEHGGAVCDQEISGKPTSPQGSGFRNFGSGVSEGINCPSSNADLRSSKYQRSSIPGESINPQLSSCALNEDEEKRTVNEDEEKRTARLMKNRESTQPSRQRKKHYVEELEDKLRSMHSTIAELNSKISYMMTENAGLRQQLRQQLSGSGMCQPSAARSKKNESKKVVGRTKKVSSINFLSLLFFIMLFGGLVPVVNDIFGNAEGVPSTLAFVEERLYNQNR